MQSSGAEMKRLTQHVTLLGSVFLTAAVLSTLLGTLNLAPFGTNASHEQLRSDPSTRAVFGVTPQKEPSRLSGTQNTSDHPAEVLLEPPHEITDGLTLIHGLNKV